MMRQGPEGAPTVSALDEQTDHHVDLVGLAELTLATVQTEGVRGDAEVNVVFVDEETMARLHRVHLGGEGPTDVLAFPIDDGSETPPGRQPDGGTAGPDRDDAEGSLPLLLGDVVVCPAVAAANAPSHAGSLGDELALLVVHGTLHLLGHDHADPEQQQRMWEREQALLAAHHRFATIDGAPPETTWAPR